MLKSSVVKTVNFFLLAQKKYIRKQSTIECTRYASVRRILRNSTFSRQAAKCERAVCKQSIASPAENRCNQKKPSTTLQIPPRPDHLYGQNLPPRRTESAMLTEHYTTVVSNSPPELFHRHSGLQALCLSHKLVCAKVTTGDVDFLSAKSSEQFRYREFQNHST